MKQIFKSIVLAFVSCVALIACGSDSDSDPGTAPTQTDGTGSVYSETINIPAEGCDKSYTLNKLSSSISSCSATPDWFTVSLLPYSSGAPGIKITARENTECTERQDNVVLTTVNNDKLLLTIVQAAAKAIQNPSGIDDVHNSTSQNPAYARRK